MTTYRKPRRTTRWIISKLRKLNIFPRILLLFCAFLAVSTGFITVLNQVSYTSEIQKTKIQELQTLAQRDSLVLNQEKVHIESSVNQFVSNPQVLEALEECRLLSMQAASGNEEARQTIDRNQEYIQNTLTAIAKQTRGVCAMVFVNSDILYKMGVAPQVLGTVYVPDPDALMESEIYTGAVDAGGYPFWRDSTADTSGIFYDSPGNSLGMIGAVTLSYQVYTPQIRQPLGVVICCVYPRHFAEVIREYSLKEGSSTYILGNQGMVEGIDVSFSAPPFPVKARELRESIFTSHSGLIQADSPKGDMLVSFFGEPGFPIHVANLTYRDYVMKPIYRQRYINIAVMLAVIAVGAAGFYVVAVSIAYPVQRLIRTMKRVGGGDFTAVYKPESHDEIGVLCNEFDNMVSDMLKLLERTYISESKQKELELAQKSAQLDALQMQVNPHFLYNTLDMIRWECLYENGGESPASDMIEKFCVLLRMTIKGDNQKETVADSLLHAETYLEVVNFRHTRKIELETVLAFAPEAYQIPCLSLQPILENAIRHGFSGEQTADRRIRIAGKKNGDNLELTIEDNGVGMTSEQLETLRQHLDSPQRSRDNIGLRNVNQRCRLCYGEGYGIRVESKLTEGTRVILTIPADPVERGDGQTCIEYC